MIINYACLTIKILLKRFPTSNVKVKLLSEAENSPDTKHIKLSDADFIFAPWDEEG